MKIEIFNNGLQKIDERATVVNPNSLTPFIYANADATANSQTFYIKVSRGRKLHRGYVFYCIYTRSHKNRKWNF